MSHLLLQSLIAPNVLGRYGRDGGFGHLQQSVSCKRYGVPIIIAKSLIKAPASGFLYDIKCLRKSNLSWHCQEVPSQCRCHKDISSVPWRIFPYGHMYTEVFYARKRSSHSLLQNGNSYGNIISTSKKATSSIKSGTFYGPH